MIRASEVREIAESLSRKAYEENMIYIHKSIRSLSEQGATSTAYRMPSDLFEKYEGELVNSLKELGYHISETGRIYGDVRFVISWKEENPFISPEREQPKWWQFWK